jgi:hypothetical protein
MKEAHRAGITPYLLRLAAHYAAKGIGEHKPLDTVYDKVIVRELMPWQPGEHFTESCLILSVDFYAHGEKLRFVEFSLRPEGFGGKPIISETRLDPEQSPLPPLPPEPQR